MAYYWGIVRHNSGELVECHTKYSTKDKALKSAIRTLQKEQRRWGDLGNYTLQIFNKPYPYSKNSGIDPIYEVKPRGSETRLEFTQPMKGLPFISSLYDPGMDFLYGASLETRPRSGMDWLQKEHLPMYDPYIHERYLEDYKIGELGSN